MAGKLLHRYHNKELARFTLETKGICLLVDRSGRFAVKQNVNGVWHRSCTRDAFLEMSGSTGISKFHHPTPLHLIQFELTKSQLRINVRGSLPLAWGKPTLSSLRSPIRPSSIHPWPVPHNARLVETLLSISSPNSALKNLLAGTACTSLVRQVR